MTLLAFFLLPLFAYLNAATGGTLRSPFRIPDTEHGGWYWWTHIMTAVTQGLAIYFFTADLSLTAIFSLGWYLWRKPEFGVWLDVNSMEYREPNTFFGRAMERVFGTNEEVLLVARWIICMIPSIIFALFIGKPILALALLVGAILTGIAYAYYMLRYLDPEWPEGENWYHEVAGGAAWGAAAICAVLVA